MNVFLSYVSADKEIARQVARGLERCGLEVWTDEEVLPGESLSAAIGTALGKADAFVVLVTKRASPSQWAGLEVGAAVASGKRVIPVLLEAGADMPLILRDRSYLDLSEPQTRGDRINLLCRTLKEPAGPVSESGVAAGMLAVEGATLALGRERTAHEVLLQSRLAWVRRTQVLVAFVVLVATAAALITAAVSGTVVLAALVTGITGVLGSGLGYYYGTEIKKEDE